VIEVPSIAGPANLDHGTSDTRYAAADTPDSDDPSGAFP